MRSFSFLALISAAVFGTSSALVDARERTTVTQSASAYDTRCDPNGCIADNTRDQDSATRWSCSEQLNNDQCTITFDFATAQDIDTLNIYFYRGDERVRTLKVTDNNGLYQIITSSGTTDGFESFNIYTDETSSLTMEALGLGSTDWISMNEVEFMVD